MRPYYIGLFAFVYKDCALTFAYNKFRIVLDFVLIALKSMYDRIVGAIEPFDNINKFVTQFFFISLNMSILK